jgi:methenyltetrahydrofolate cyclohydrolase
VSPVTEREAQPPAGREAQGYLDGTLARFLDQVASKEPAPGGGAAAAVTVAMAAGLVAMAARFAVDHLPDATDVVSCAEVLRRRAAPLAQADADAYQAYLAALRLPRERKPDARRRQVQAARSRAAEVPLTVTEIAADVAGLAARLAAGGNPNLRGDAVTAALLAEAGAWSAASLVEINVGAGDQRAARAANLANAAAGAARRALDARR